MKRTIKDNAELDAHDFIRRYIKYNDGRMTDKEIEDYLNYFANYINKWINGEE